MKKQNSIRVLSDHFIPIILGLFLLILSITLIPRVSSTLFPQKQQTMLINYIDRTLMKEKRIDPQIFWQFREFYSTGSLLFEKSGHDQSTVTTTLRSMGMTSTNIPLHTFLIYRSPKIISIDALVTEADAKLIIQQPLTKHKKLLQTSSVQLSTGSNEYILIFIGTQDDMKKTISFFDYEGIDRKLLEKKVWLNITRITH